MPDFLVFLLVIGGLILGHELGHFIAAKLLGVKVEEFGIGFPPRLITLFTAGDTKFSINLIPFGGFVRLSGEDDPTVEGGLASASKKVRTAVLLAGPAANILIAIIAFTAAFKFAAPDEARVMVTGIDEASPAESVGVLPGDVFLEVDEVTIDGVSSLVAAISDNLGEETVFIFERKGEPYTVVIIPRVNPPEGRGAIGVTLGHPSKDIGWVESFTSGIRSATFQMTELVYLPSRVIRGEIAPEQARVSGFKGMYDLIAWAGEIDRTAQRPFLTLNLIGIISIGLAIANLLPIPALDGGRLTFIGIEAVIGRRISPQYEGLAHAIGFFVLLAILIYVNFLDFVKPIPLP
ncbi:MAG: hypothetical protein GTO18_01465 [Anaerolineales bacterium]|nr:hypothetical protein [Anaerolineales bacterium]